MSENKNIPSLKDLGDRIEKAKIKALGGRQEGSSPASGAMRVSVDLLAGVIGGSFLGYYLDKWLGTTPIFFISCFFLGIAGAVRNIMRTISQSNKREQ